MNIQLYESTFSFVANHNEYKIVFYCFPNTVISSIYVFLKKDMDWKIIEAKDIDLTPQEINFDKAKNILLKHI